jgi:hypothetical protein
MELTAFREELRARGGECSVWLVYLADQLAELQEGRLALVLREAFLRRGDAYALAERYHQQRRWQQYYVFRVDVDLEWSDGDVPRVAVHEMAFGRTRELPEMAVTPAEVAGALQL